MVITLFSLSPVFAANLYFDNIAINRIVDVNGLSFLKTGDGKYQMIIPTNFPEYMQDFTKEHCAQIPMPACVAADNCITSTDINNLFTQGPVLKDKRDGRVYEIRKYADGQCWMADDLKFGGTTESVAGTTATLLNNYCTQQSPFTVDTTNNGNPNPDWFNVDENGLSTGTNLRGMCFNSGPMNEATGVLSTGTTSSYGTYGWQYASANTGYLYDWGAAAQDDYDAAMGTRKVQGICPRGWHLPVSGGNSTDVAGQNDFVYLDKLYGGPGTYNQTTTTHARVYFWGMPVNNASLPTAWKGTFPGCAGNGGCVSSFRGNEGDWRSSGAGEVLVVTSTVFFPNYPKYPGFGWQVRCIVD